MEWHTKRIIVGIRHKKLFKSLNTSGHIIDELVSLQDSGPFPKNCFQKCNLRKDNMGFKLNDEDETLILDFGIDGFVLTIDMEAEPPLNLYEIKDMVKEIISRTLVINGGIKYINRFGIINEFVFSPFKNSAETAMAKIIQNIEITGTPDNFYTRIAFKNPIKEGLIKGGIDDYKNVILQINSEKIDEFSDIKIDVIKLSIDYQIYFSPEREFMKDAYDKHFGDFENYCSEIKSSNLKILTDDIIR